MVCNTQPMVTLLPASRLAYTRLGKRPAQSEHFTRIEFTRLHARKGSMKHKELIEAGGMKGSVRIQTGDFARAEMLDHNTNLYCIAGGDRLHDLLKGVLRRTHRRMRLRHLMQRAGGEGCDSDGDGMIGAQEANSTA